MLLTDNELQVVELDESIKEMISLRGIVLESNTVIVKSSDSEKLLEHILKKDDVVIGIDILANEGTTAHDVLVDFRSIIFDEELNVYYYVS